MVIATLLWCLFATLPSSATTTQETDSRAATQASESEAADGGQADADADALDSQPHQVPRTLYERLSPRQRVQAMAGMAVVALLGFLLLFCIWAGARMTRWYLRDTRNSRPAPSGQDLDDWARKPLVPKTDPDDQVP